MQAKGQRLVAVVECLEAKHMLVAIRIRKNRFGSADGPSIAVAVGGKQVEQVHLTSLVEFSRKSM